MVRRTHHCRRCGSPIDPGDVYAALDVLDGGGRLRVLLCDRCAGALRAFIDGDGDRDGDREIERDRRDGTEEVGGERPDTEPDSGPV